MRISDWSSDVCSSDLILGTLRQLHLPSVPFEQRVFQIFSKPLKGSTNRRLGDVQSFRSLGDALFAQQRVQHDEQIRSEEHTSELQSLMRNSYAVFCLKKKKKPKNKHNHIYTKQ